MSQLQDDELTASQEPAQQDEQEREREQQQAAKLLECEKLFTQPDSIMEPGILEVLRRYLELGGSAQDGADFLIDKYVGEESNIVYLNRTPAREQHLTGC